MENTNKRNINLDAFKTIAAISVVFIHYNHVSGCAGELYTRIIYNITTFAVPLFFVITGFYILPLIEKQRSSAYVRKILQMALCSSLLYFVFYLIDSPDRLDWLKTHYTIGTMFTWLTGQDDPAGFHLWYFYCLLWSFTIVSAVLKYLGAVALYIIALLMVIYHFTGNGMFYCYTISLPALTIGVCLFKNKDKVMRIPPKIAIACGIGMIGLMSVEAYYNNSVPGYYYEGHILALILFVFAICSPSIPYAGKLAYIGLEYSALIYIFHVLANNLLCRVFEFDSVVSQIARPLFVFAISLILARSFIYISRLKIAYGTHKN